MGAPSRNTRRTRLGSGGTSRIRRHIQEGLRFVVGDAMLRAVCLASAAFRFFFSAVTTGCLLFPPRALHICRARSSG
ncbi:hypothetical protein DV517_41110 [Streptomyces sp. S816]|nr:hypothetical protein DV517_41110 [Streptomyces sp. S816]